MKHKILFSLLTIFLGINCLQAQKQTKLSLVKFSEDPIYKKEHFHKIELQNNNKKVIQYRLQIENVKCRKATSVESKLVHQLYDLNMNPIKKSIQLKAGESYEFYLKLTTPTNTRLGVWNCTEVTVFQSEFNSLENIPLDTILIKSLIPNPTTAN